MPSYFVIASLAGSDSYRARTMGFAKSGVYGGPLLGQLLLEPIVARTNVEFVLCLLGLLCTGFALHFAWQGISQRRLAIEQNY